MVLRKEILHTNKLKLKIMETSPKKTKTFYGLTSVFTDGTYCRCTQLFETKKEAQRIKKQAIQIEKRTRFSKNTPKIKTIFIDKYYIK